MMCSVVWRLWCRSMTHGYFLLLFFWLLSVLQGTHGSGIFELQVLEMANPRSELSTGQCCGGGQRSPVSNRCSTPCQTFFRLCLKEYQSNVTSTGTCSFGNTSSQVLGRDTFTLADPDRGRLVLPFTFRWTMVDGDLRGISQPSVCKIIKRVSIVFAEHLGEFISFPNTLLDQQSNIRKFHQIANFPNVSACVDGTHILIKNPGGHIGEIFRNRKGLFSLNVQVACGPNMEIMDIVVRHPGSTHDNVIFEQSGLRVRFENNEVQGLILGDNGYACKRYLLTPVINPANDSEQNYNRAHIRTRNIVERTFGIWKRRFPCLQRVLKTKEETSVAIICATAILHNIARNFNDNINFEINEPDNADWFNNIVIEQDGGDGLAFRRAFILTHF